MSDRFRVSSLLAGKLEEQRISLSAVASLANLPDSFFRQERIYVSTKELFALWRAIADVSGDSAIGLKLGAEGRIEKFDPAAIAAQCSRSFRDAIYRMARYKQLTCPEEIRVSSTVEECMVEFAWLLAHEAEPDILVDLCLSWILGIGRRGSANSIVPLRVELTRESGNRELLEQHYGCRIKFKSRRNALTFRVPDLDRPFITHNAELLAMLGPQLDAELSARSADLSTADHVKSALKQMLAGQRPTIHDVAKHIGTSARTLQRRLTAAGHTFQRLLDESRRELAHHYLAQSTLELNETAYLLGFEDANSFFRAFQHWEGTSPGQWRRNQKRDTFAT